MTKVKSIHVENLKAISKAELNLDGKSAIVIAGNNKGKTTLLSLLIKRLQGERPDIIVKQGEHEGVYKMELTDGSRFEWEVNDTNKKGDNLSDIKYFTTDNIRTSVTKDIATKHFPNGFDIDTFLSGTPKQQQKALQALAGINFDDIDTRYKAAFENRTDKNRAVNQAKGSLKAVLKSLPNEEEDTLSIQQEIAGLDAHNNKFNYVKKGVDDKQIDLEKNNKEIARLEKLIKGLQTENRTLEKDIKGGNDWMAIEANKPKGDDENFRLNQKLQTVIDGNKKITENNQAIKDNVAFDLLIKEAEKADEKVKSIEQEKVDLIRTAKLPEEFGFGEEGILYKGLPFTKEQQSLSGLYIAALKLSFLSIGKVRMVHFDASPLTNASLKEVQEWADSNDLQILIERPDIENDGEIQYTLVEK